MEPRFEHLALEQDIERLAAEVTKKGGEAPEIKKEALRAAIGGRIYREPSEVNISPKGEESRPLSALPSYIQKSSDEIKLEVEKLIDLAWHKGINAAVAEARKKGTFILDALHDTLTDKLYEEFKKRKLIK